jgi:glutamate-1-semialdehyde 2,1-aminomutase
VVSYSHTDEDIDLTVAAIDGALEVYRRALDDSVDRYLVGRPSQTVYRAYNRPDEPAQALGRRLAAEPGADRHPRVSA